MFTLHCGDYFPASEQKFRELLLDEVSGQKDPFAQHLIVVPTRALRKRLLSVLSSNLYGVHILTINHLAIKIILEGSDSSKRLVSDPLFFPFALNQLTRSPALKRFSGFRTCLAVYQTLRDLSDGGISPEVFEQVLNEVREAPELARQIDFEESFSLHRIYEAFEGMLSRNDILNLLRLFRRRCHWRSPGSARMNFHPCLFMVSTIALKHNLT